MNVTLAGMVVRMDCLIPMNYSVASGQKIQYNEKTILRKGKIHMKRPLNMHRPSSVIAAVFMILSQVLNIAASLSASNAYFTHPTFLISLFGNALITVVLSAILFRGRKDAFAGVMFFVAGIAPVLSVLYYFSAVLLATESVFYALLCLLSGFLETAFLGLAAKECWSEGNVSVGNGRVLLWLLPVLCFCVELWAQMILCSYDGMTTGEMVTSSLVYLIPQWLGPILMGVSLSVPEKSEDC